MTWSREIPELSRVKSSHEVDKSWLSRRKSAIVYHVTFFRRWQPSTIASMASAVGVRRSVYSQTPAGLNCFCSELQTTEEDPSGKVESCRVIESANVVCVIGLMLGAQLSMREHVSRTTHAWFFHMRRLHSVRRLFGHDVIPFSWSSILHYRDWIHVMLLLMYKLQLHKCL